MGATKGGDEIMTDEPNITKRAGTKHLKTFPVGEPIVSMIQFKGTLYVASTKGVFRLIDDEFHQMKFVFLPDEASADFLQGCPHGLLWDNCPDCRH